MMKIKMVCGALLLWVVVASGSAFAKDAVQAAVSSPTGSPIVVVSGNPYAMGTYAVGTIQLLYTVNDFRFTPGHYASFTLNWKDVFYNSNPAVEYGSGITLNLEPIGGDDVILTADPASFSVSGAGASGSSNVTIAISAAAASDPDKNCDGCELVGHLRLVTDPAGSHLDTVTDILVKIKLVHPTACLKLYNFITDEALLNTVTATDVNVNKKGSVTSTNPYGQLSDNVLLVNTCPVAKSFDLGITLDGHFETNPNGNPGNAVFTYSTGGELDPDTFLFSAFGLGSPRGESLCLNNLTVAAGDTFFAMVHMGISKAVWTGGDAGTFNFAAAGYSAGTAANTSCVGTLHPDLPAPNPTGTSLTYTKK